MSEQSARAFVKKLASDPAFRGKVDAAASDAEKQAIAQAAGYIFTKAEVEAVIAALSRRTATKLSDQDLESVAGGSTEGWVVTGLGSAGIVITAAAAAAA